MKIIKYLLVASAFSTVGCSKLIDLNPQSNITANNYYSTATEVNTALNGCYNSMQTPLTDEWTLTELRSDNAVQGSASSVSVPNRDLSDLDMYFPSTSHQGIYNYWLNTYYNIRNTNFVLNSLGVNYSSSAGTLSFDPITSSINAADVKRLSAEATFIRAHHYFNLVRLYGDVFLVHKPISPEEAKLVNRSPVAEVYKLIIADLLNTVNNGSTAKFGSIASTDIGRVNSWCAKALLAKVYLTLNRKTEAAILLQDIITNSNYSLQASYANLFSIANEMNSEMMFCIRFKAGGIGLGSNLPNLWAPVNSGSAVVVGDGKGYNTPSQDLYNSYTAINATGSTTTTSNNITLSAANPLISIGMPVTGLQITQGTTVTAVNGAVITLSIKPSATLVTTALLAFGGDPRRITNIGIYTGRIFYPNKYMSAVAIANDAENDFPVLRYADVLLMLAEAQGNSAISIGLINQVRVRTGNSALTTTVINTVALFEKALSDERRWEFAFENQRFFDLVRFNTTMSTITFQQTMKDHFAIMYPFHYINYPNPKLTVTDLQNLVTTNKLLLPIPQREIDNNTAIVIKQNPGY